MSRPRWRGRLSDRKRASRHKEQESLELTRNRGLYLPKLASIQGEKNNPHPVLSNRLLSRLGKGRRPIIAVRRPLARSRAKPACNAYPASSLRDNRGQTVFCFCLEWGKQAGHIRHCLAGAWQVAVPAKNKKPEAGNCTGYQDREAAASGCKKAICGMRSGQYGVRLGLGTYSPYSG